MTDKCERSRVFIKLILYFFLTAGSMNGLIVLHENAEDAYTKFLQGCFLISAVVFLFLFLLTLRKYLRMKGVRKPFDLIKRFFKSLSNFFLKVFRKLGIQYNGKLLGGSDHVEFVYPGMRKTKKSEKPYRYKLPRWSELTNNHERIRYIYTVFLLRKQRTGYRINPAATPASISDEICETSEQTNIFKIYNLARYANVVEIKSDDVERLLKTVNDKK
ncbi:MAG: hypothetical protein A2Y17_11440 [Clostridiales bacterium GWF2_38_85]|nr:MAG: hypothetical protein A2Y17_11440 [Clostridiales bacterium GWF2_38_85]HBL85086.1 hypothetical protein [Clostridiales bacterium]